MSFTTRCPACGTTFKVVPDQLKISDGWVRCGHCADVFDATLFLEDAVATTLPTVPTPSRPAVRAPVFDVAAPPAAALVVSDSEGDWLVPPFSAKAPPAAKAPPVGQAHDKGSSKVSAELPRTAVVPAAKAAAAPAVKKPVAQEGYELPVAPERIPEDPQDPQDQPLLPAEPGFVRQARRRAFWRSPGMRSALMVVALLLGLSLLAQHAVYQRDHLAARFPAATPLLETLCLPTGCKIGPLRQIESVVIDSSNLVRRLGNFYSFDFVLKNSASMPVAVPALELSLTDTRDAVIVRRVFLPGELPGAPQLLPAQGSLSLSLRLSIADQGVSSMSGYRALVFYP